MSRATLFIGTLLTLAVTACTDVPAPTAAADPSSLAVVKPAVCASVTLPTTSVVVTNKVAPPLRYSVANCGTRKLNVIVTVYEVFGQMSELCPSPVAAPVRMTLSSGRTTNSSFVTYRGACGYVSPFEQTVVMGIAGWQAHRLMVSVRNAADNALLSTTASPFTWQDAVPTI